VVSAATEKQRISLSLKALLDKPVKPSDDKPADEDLPLLPDAPKPPAKKHQQLKGGTGGPTGGEQFGLKW